MMRLEAFNKTNIKYSFFPKPFRINLNENSEWGSLGNNLR